MMFSSRGTSFLLLMLGIIILSGMVFKDSIDRLRGGGGVVSGAEGLENMQKQNFNLTPGTYPATLDALLLSPEYPMPGAITNVPDTLAVSAATATILGSEYPAPTNNPRYAASPDNDTCMPMTMCNSFYGMRNEHPKPAPPAIPLSDPRRRVNYYAADSLDLVGNDLNE